MLHCDNERDVGLGRTRYPGAQKETMSGKATGSLREPKSVATAPVLREKNPPLQKPLVME